MTVRTSGQAGTRSGEHERGARPAAAIVVAFSVACSAMAAMAAENDGAGGPLATGSAEYVRQLPAGVPVDHHYYNPSAGEHRVLATGLPNEDPVYSNTPPPAWFLALGIPDIPIADDITTVAIGGCGVRAYEIQVAGGGDGTGPGFTTTFALYDDCPHGGGQLIPGTGGSVTTGHDGLHTVFVDLTAAPVTVEQSFWISVSVDSETAGWVFGTPADVGYTRPVYDFPYVPCRAHFHGTPLYEGFYARVWCEPPFDTEFPAYINSDVTGMQFDLDAGQWLMDDVWLTTNGCVLSSFEIGAVGTGGGNVTMTAELQRSCGASHVIPGTQWEAQFPADGAPAWVRFNIPGGVDLGTDNMFWMAYKFDRAASAIVSGQAVLGFTDDLFGLLNESGGCDFFWFQGNPYAGFAINVNCLGPTPQGACCDIHEPGGEFCRHTQQASCAWGDLRWVLDGDCDDPNAFDPPCGTAACCLPPYSPYGETCRNMPEEECAQPDNQDADGNPAVWQPGEFCGVGPQDCISWVCRFAEGPCDIIHPGNGCNVPSCCDAVCDQDSFCCNVGWDSTCVTRALLTCGDSIPVANDDCYSPVAGAGAVMLNECGGADCGGPNDPPCPGGQQCLNFHCDGGNHDQCFDVANSSDCPQGQQCLADGRMDLSNDRATSSPDEGFCCHPNGAGTTGYGGVWAKFKATETTARVDTCGANMAPATDGLLQVFKATDQTSEEAACSSLVPIGCNDDSEWTSCLDGQAAVCLEGLVIGDTYYVLVDSKGADTKGTYRVRVTSPAMDPCTGAGSVPDNDTCGYAIGAGVVNTFDTIGATLDCPTETCAPGMTGDVWYVFTATATGIVTMDTCAEPDQDTILIAYADNECPATVDRRIICDDNAGGVCGLGAEITFAVDELQSYLIRVGVRDGDEFIGTLNVGSIAPDCNRNGIPDLDDIASGASQDCDDDGIPDECQADWVLTGSTPPNLAIDARQPHEPSDAGARRGWDSITLYFLGVAPVMLPDTPDAYAVSDPTLTIVHVTVSGASATLQFDRPITPGQWLCAALIEGANSSCIGSLPGDVNSDRVTDPSDMISLIDCINGVATIACDEWQADIDHSGALEPADIVGLLDLLNGAAAFDPWYGVVLPDTMGDCP